MGGGGSQQAGAGRVQNANPRSAEYLKLSLHGKWIKLARLWLDDNTPCEVVKYYDELTPLMPTHIMRHGDERVSKLTLAKEALSYLKPKRDGSIIVEVDRTPNRHSEALFRLLGGKDVFSLSEFKREHNLTPKEMKSFRKWLLRNGCVAVVPKGDILKRI